MGGRDGRKGRKAPDVTAQVRQQAAQALAKSSADAIANRGFERSRSILGGSHGRSKTKLSQHGINKASEVGIRQMLEASARNSGLLLRGGAEAASLASLVGGST